MVFFVYEYTYAIGVYTTKSRAEPDQILNRLELLKRRERITALRWSVLGVLCLCAFPLFDYKPEENTRWAKACHENVTKISQGLIAYYKDKGTYPPAYIADAAGKPIHSWRVLILPYIGEQKVYDQYNFAEPWYGPHNRLLTAKIPDTYLCPVRNTRYSSLLAQWLWSPISYFSNYAIVAGAGTPFTQGKAPKYQDFADGIEQTLLLVEHAGSRGSWLKPDDISCGQFSALPASELTMHYTPNNTFHACFANGSITTLPSTMSGTDRNELAQCADRLPRKTFGRY
jgi:hypothetical protein